jgi:tight adherence protein C
MPAHAILRGLFVGFVVLVAFGVTLWVSSRPSRKNSRLGMRGLKRQEALLRSPSWATLEPFVRWMGVRVGPLLGSRAHAKLDVQLTYAGDVLGLTADEYFGAVVTSGILGGLVAAGIATVRAPDVLGMAIVGGIAAGALVPYALVDNARADRYAAIGRGLPYAIDMMALSMSAGLDFPSSVEQVVEKAKANDALREELGYLLQQLRLGSTRVQALRELAARVPIDSVREFVQALIQAEERGNAVSNVLEVQAVTARTRRSNLAEKAAEDTMTRMTIPITILTVIPMVLILTGTSMMLGKTMEKVAIPDRGKSAQGPR